MTAVQPTFDASAVVRTVLVEMARREVPFVFSPRSIGRATEAAEALLRWLGYDESDTHQAATR